MNEKELRDHLRKHTEVYDGRICRMEHDGLIAVDLYPIVLKIGDEGDGYVLSAYVWEDEDLVPHADLPITDGENTSLEGLTAAELALSVQRAHKEARRRLSLRTAEGHVMWPATNERVRFAEDQLPRMGSMPIRGEKRRINTYASENRRVHVSREERDGKSVVHVITKRLNDDGEIVQSLTVHTEPTADLIQEAVDHYLHTNNNRMTV